MKRILTDRNRLSAALGMIFLLVTLLPLLYCSFFDYATGDDLGYSAGLHRVMTEGGSVTDCLKCVVNTIQSVWHAFQGTWSSVLLFQLQPGIWGERVYSITLWVALICIMGGTYYFLRYFLVDKLTLDKNVFYLSYALIMVLTIQYMPTVRGGLFWWTSVAHYVIPYGIALCCFTWSMKWLDTGKIRYLILQMIGMLHLGGGGYPEVVLAAGWFFFLIVACVIHIYKSSGKLRVLMLGVPLIIEMVGFMVSAIAPGNKVRGGEEFGFSAGRVLSTIAGAVIAVFKDGIGYCISVRPTVFLMVIIVAALLEVQIKRTVTAYELAYVILATFLINCGIRMPEIYAGVGVSGGVPDTYHFVFYISLFVVAAYLVQFIVQNKPGIIDTAKKIQIPVYLGSICLMLILSKYLIGSSADYMCAEFISSGALNDFRYQMTERLEILEDDSIKDVVLPEMNEYQGPFMHMPLSNDPEQFDNRVTKEYYGKNSVIAIPRDEWNAIYGK